MGLYVLQIDKVLLWLTPAIKRLPKTDRVEEVSVASMNSQSVWAHPRCLVNFGRLVLVFQTGADHPPANSTLEPSQSEETDQSIPQPGHDVTSGHEVDHGTEEDDTNGAADDPVEPLPEEDILKLVDVHARVPVRVLVLGRLLILFKFLFPLCTIHRRQDSMWFPSHHRQAALGESGVSSDHDDGENARTD